MLPHKVDLVLDTIDNLRPIPSSVTRILREIDDPATSVTTISKYIGMDQALTAMVIKTSNSVAMGYRNKCSSIKVAVMRIGFKRIKAILFALNAIGPMTGKLNGYRLGGGQLWDHSLKIATTSEWLARTLHYSEPEEAYITGLLHDIGKLLLDQFVLEDYQKFAEQIKNYHFPVWQVEEMLVGIDHANLGGMMAARWNFPDSLIEGIRFHHTPSSAKTNQVLPAIVNLANLLSTQQDDLENVMFSNDLHPDTMKILNLDQKDMVNLSQSIDSIIAVPTE